MQVLTLRRKNNETLDVDFPEDFSEISLEAALEWLAVEEQLHTCVTAEKFDKVLYLTLLTQAVANFLGINIDDLFGHPVGDLEVHLRTFKPSEVKNTTENIVQIFERIAYIFTTVEPKIYIDKEFTFEHNDFTYKVPNFIKNSLTTGISNPKLSVGEAIECLEVKRRIHELKTNTPEQRKNASYTELITLTAILARKVSKDVEHFPADQSDIDIFINSRVKEFETLKADVGFDVGFFLTSIISF